MVVALPPERASKRASRYSLEVNVGISEGRASEAECAMCSDDDDDNGEDGD